MKRTICICMLAAALLNPSLAVRPNIVLIYGDDVGYGDLGCYGATGIETPHLDRLAAGGIRFTDAYATTATCTPSRFSLLTGEYAFRNRKAQVLPGHAPLIIEPGKETLPSVLRRAGYTTGVVGKWYLGLGSADSPADWNGEIKPGPLEVGFDHSFIMAATGDRVPCVYVRDRRVADADPEDPIEVRYSGKPFPGLPTGVTHREGLKMDWSHGHNNAVVNGISRIGYMKGGNAALWKDEDMAQVFTREAVSFIDRSKENPFFLFFATHDIHVPRVPNPEFVGKTGQGPRGDAMVQFDWCAGQLVEALERHGLLENTLIIVTSDNGAVLDDGYKDDAVEKLGSHKPSGPLRGGKYSPFEGGTRMPTISYWKGRIEPAVSDALISQVDLVASLAALTGQDFDASEARDSQDVLAALLGDSRKGRESLVQQANVLAIRKGDWKWIPAGESDWDWVRSGAVREELGPWKITRIPKPGFLFNLADDPGETRNLVSEQPERVAELSALLEEIRADGGAAMGAGTGEK